jgi:predicted esterase
MNARHVTVPRTARYFVAGAPGVGPELWYVLHGYGQLAERFLHAFASLDDHARCIVAPEGLSRFYLESGRGDRVGASWMTREDRVSEIADYVRYLDLLHAELMLAWSAGEARVTVLGFSQGTATAARWLAQGQARARRLILWGGEVPPDLDLTDARERWRETELTLVVGSSDRFITAKVLARDEARLHEAGIPYRVVRFEGGHEIVADVLGRLTS